MTETKAKEVNAKNKPLLSAKNGQIDIALWKNKNRTSGEEYYTVGVQKSYRTKDGSYRQSKMSVYPSELLNLINALTQFAQDFKQTYPDGV